MSEYKFFYWCLFFVPCFVGFVVSLFLRSDGGIFMKAIFGFMCLFPALMMIRYGRRMRDERD
jgi:hypothetical protein